MASSKNSNYTTNTKTTGNSASAAAQAAAKIKAAQAVTSKADSSAHYSAAKDKAATTPIAPKSMVGNSYSAATEKTKTKTTPTSMVGNSYSAATQTKVKTTTPDVTTGKTGKTGISDLGVTPTLTPKTEVKTEITPLFSAKAKQEQSTSKGVKEEKEQNLTPEQKTTEDPKSSPKGFVSAQDTAEEALKGAEGVKKVFSSVADFLKSKFSSEKSKDAVDTSAYELNEKETANTVAADTKLASMAGSSYSEALEEAEEKRREEQNKVPTYTKDIRALVEEGMTPEEAYKLAVNTTAQRLGLDPEDYYQERLEADSKSGVITYTKDNRVVIDGLNPDGTEYAADGYDEVHTGYIGYDGVLVNGIYVAPSLAQAMDANENYFELYGKEYSGVNGEDNEPYANMTFDTYSDLFEYMDGQYQEIYTALENRDGFVSEEDRKTLAVQTGALLEKVATVAGWGVLTGNNYKILSDFYDSVVALAKWQATDEANMSRYDDVDIRQIDVDPTDYSSLIAEQEKEIKGLENDKKWYINTTYNGTEPKVGDDTLNSYNQKLEEANAKLKQYTTAQNSQARQQEAVLEKQTLRKYLFNKDYQTGAWNPSASLDDVEEQLAGMEETSEGYDQLAYEKSWLESVVYNKTLLSSTNEWLKTWDNDPANATEEQLAWLTSVVSKLEGTASKLKTEAKDTQGKTAGEKLADDKKELQALEEEIKTSGWEAMPEDKRTRLYELRDKTANEANYSDDADVEDSKGVRWDKFKAVSDEAGGLTKWLGELLFGPFANKLEEADPAENYLSIEDQARLDAYRILLQEGLGDIVSSEVIDTINQGGSVDSVVEGYETRLSELMTQREAGIQALVEQGLSESRAEEIYDAENYSLSAEISLLQNMINLAPNYKTLEVTMQPDFEEKAKQGAAIGLETMKTVLTVGKFGSDSEMAKAMQAQGEALGMSQENILQAQNYMFTLPNSREAYPTEDWSDTELIASGKVPDLKDALKIYYAMCVDDFAAATLFAININSAINEAKLGDFSEDAYTKWSEEIEDGASLSVIDTLGLHAVTGLANIFGGVGAFGQSQAEYSTLGFTYVDDPDHMSFKDSLTAQQQANTQAWSDSTNAVNTLLKDITASVVDLGTVSSASASAIQSAECAGLAMLLAGVLGIGNAAKAASANLGSAAAEEAGQKAVQKFVGDFTNYVFFFDSAQQTMEELSAEGYEWSQARILSYAAGAIEGLTEKYSVESLVSLAESKHLTGKALKRFLLTKAHQTFCEASEEVVGSLANEGVDLGVTYLVNAITKDDGKEWKTQIQRGAEDYVAQGYSYSDARSQAIADWGAELRDSAIQGGLSGFMGGTVAFAKNQINMTELGRAYEKKASLIADCALTEADSNFQNKQTASGIKDLAQKVKSGKASTAEIGRLVAALDEDSTGHIDDYLLANAEEFLYDSGEYGNRLMLAKARSMEKVYGEHISKLSGAYSNRFLPQIKTSVDENGKTTISYEGIVVDEKGHITFDDSTRGQENQRILDGIETDLVSRGMSVEQAAKVKDFLTQVFTGNRLYTEERIATEVDSLMGEDKNALKTVYRFLYQNQQQSEVLANNISFDAVYADDTQDNYKEAVTGMLQSAWVNSFFIEEQSDEAYRKRMAKSREIARAQAEQAEGKGVITSGLLRKLGIARFAQKGQIANEAQQILNGSVRAEFASPEARKAAFTMYINGWGEYTGGEHYADFEGVNTLATAMQKRQATTTANAIRNVINTPEIDAGEWAERSTINRKGNDTVTLPSGKTYTRESYVEMRVEKGASKEKANQEFDRLLSLFEDSPYYKNTSAVRGEKGESHEESGSERERGSELDRQRPAGETEEKLGEESRADVFRKTGARLTGKHQEVVEEENYTTPQKEISDKLRRLGYETVFVYSQNEKTGVREVQDSSGQGAYAFEDYDHHIIVVAISGVDETSWSSIQDGKHETAHAILTVLAGKEDSPKRRANVDTLYKGIFGNKANDILPLYLAGYAERIDKKNLPKAKDYKTAHDYAQALYNFVKGNTTKEDFEALLYTCKEEMLADAYAGINRYGSKLGSTFQEAAVKLIDPMYEMAEKRVADKQSAAKAQTTEEPISAPTEQKGKALTKEEAEALLDEQRELASKLAGVNTQLSDKQEKDIQARIDQINERLKSSTHLSKASELDTKYRRSMDSEGYDLMPGQESFFSRSMARDWEDRLTRLYHGTRKGGFVVFDRAYAKDGFFFTTRYEIAQGYAGRYDYDVLDEEVKTGQEDVYAVYLDLQNPLIVYGQTCQWDEIPYNVESGILYTLDELSDEDKEKIASNMGVSVEDLTEEEDWVSGDTIPSYSLEKITQVEFTPMRTNEIARYAEAQGYDGVIFYDIDDSVSGSEVTQSDVYVAFKPEQIKSVNNYNPTKDPSIRRSFTEDLQDICEDRGYNIEKLLELSPETILRLAERIYDSKESKVAQTLAPKRALRKLGLFKSIDTQELFGQLREYFKETDDVEEAGMVLPDGTMLVCDSMRIVKELRKLPLYKEHYKLDVLKQQPADDLLERGVVILGRERGIILPARESLEGPRSLTGSQLSAITEFLSSVDYASLSARDLGGATANAGSYLTEGEALTSIANYYSGGELAPTSATEQFFRRSGIEDPNLMKAEDEYTNFDNYYNDLCQGSEEDQAKAQKILTNYAKAHGYTEVMYHWYIGEKGEYNTFVLGPEASHWGDIYQIASFIYNRSTQADRNRVNEGVREHEGSDFFDYASFDRINSARLDEIERELRKGVQFTEQRTHQRYQEFKAYLNVGRSISYNEDLGTWKAGNIARHLLNAQFVDGTFNPMLFDAGEGNKENTGRWDLGAIRSLPHEYQKNFWNEVSDFALAESNLSYGDTEAMEVFAGIMTTYGIDSIAYDNRGEGKTQGGYNLAFLLFDPVHAVKSADLITYDDNGEIIPITERFNEKIMDVRRSKTEELEISVAGVMRQNLLAAAKVAKDETASYALSVYSEPRWRATVNDPSARDALKQYGGAPLSVAARNIIRDGLAGFGRLVDYFTRHNSPSHPGVLSQKKMTRRGDPTIMPVISAKDADVGAQGDYERRVYNTYGRNPAERYANYATGLGAIEDMSATHNLDQHVVINADNRIEMETLWWAQNGFNNPRGTNLTIGYESAPGLKLWRDYGKQMLREAKCLDAELYHHTDDTNLYYDNLKGDATAAGDTSQGSLITGDWASSFPILTKSDNVLAMENYVTIVDVASEDKAPIETGEGFIGSTRYISSEDQTHNFAKLTAGPHLVAIRVQVLNAPINGSIRRAYAVIDLTERLGGSDAITQELSNGKLTVGKLAKLYETAMGRKAYSRAYPHSSDAWSQAQLEAVNNYNATASKNAERQLQTMREDDALWESFDAQQAFWFSPAGQQILNDEIAEDITDEDERQEQILTSLGKKLLPWRKANARLKGYTGFGVIAEPEYEDYEPAMLARIHTFVGTAEDGKNAYIPYAGTAVLMQKKDPETLEDLKKMKAVYGFEKSKAVDINQFCTSPLFRLLGPDTGVFDKLNIRATPYERKGIADMVNDLTTSELRKLGIRVNISEGDLAKIKAQTTERKMVEELNALLERKLSVLRLHDNLGNELAITFAQYQIKDASPLSTWSVGPENDMEVITGEKVSSYVDIKTGAPNRNPLGSLTAVEQEVTQSDMLRDLPVIYHDGEYYVANSASFDSNSNLLRRSLTEDNYGNELTDAKSLYFNDTLARDSFGRLIRWWHGTKDLRHTTARGYWVTNDPYVAATYSGADIERSVTDVDNMRQAGNVPFYANVRAPLVLDCNLAEWDHIPLDILPEEVRDYITQHHNRKFETTTDKIVEAMSSFPQYDSVWFRDVIDLGEEPNAGALSSDVLWVRYPNGLKDAYNEEPTRHPDWRLSQVDEDAEAVAQSGLPEELYFYQKAIETFGATNNTKEAGYLLYDGTMLDFSGRLNGGPSNRRTMDHRDVGELFLNPKVDGSNAMHRFIGYGNIRLMPENGNITLSEGIEPTEAQYEQLRKFYDNHGVGEYVDFSFFEMKDNGDMYSGSSEYNYYPDGQYYSADTVIEDLKYFYRTGRTTDHTDDTSYRLSKVDEMVPTYSQAVEVVKTKYNNKGMKVEEIIPFLRRQGVKEDEIVFQHLAERIEAMGKDVVPRADLLRLLNDDQLQMRMYTLSNNFDKYAQAMAPLYEELNTLRQKAKDLLSKSGIVSLKAEHTINYSKDYLAMRRALMEDLADSAESTLANFAKEAKRVSVQNREDVKPFEYFEAGTFANYVADSFLADYEEPLFLDPAFTPKTFDELVQRFVSVHRQPTRLKTPEERMDAITKGFSEEDKQTLLRFVQYAYVENKKAKDFLDAEEWKEIGAAWENVNARMSELDRARIDMKTEWSRFTMNGLSGNYEELLFVPTGEGVSKEYVNPAMKTHFTGAKGYKSILFFTRRQEAEDAVTGEVGMNIEEIQSDWQNGFAKYGAEGTLSIGDFEKASDEAWVIAADYFYSSSEREFTREEMDDLYTELNEALAPVKASFKFFTATEVMREKDIRVLFFGDEYVGEVDAWSVGDIPQVLRNLVEKAPRLLTYQAPPMPFTKTYTEQALKQNLYDAAQRGLGFVSWSNARVHDERWAQGHEAKEEGGRSGFLKGYAIEYGDPGYENHDPESRKENIFKSEIGKFMKKFAKKYGAEYGLRYVGYDSDSGYRDYMEIMENRSKDELFVEDPSSDIPAYFDTLGGIEEDDSELHEVPYIEITPAMREALLNEEKPVFARYSKTDVDEHVGEIITSIDEILDNRHATWYNTENSNERNSNESYFRNDTRGNTERDRGVQNGSWVSGRLYDRPDDLGGTLASRNSRLPEIYRINDIAAAEAIDKMLKDRGIVLSGDADEYQRSMEHAFLAGAGSHMWRVDPIDQSRIDNEGIDTYLLNGAAGAGVTADGDLVGLFKDMSSQMRGAGKALMPIAIAKGAIKGDCYGYTLTKLYAKFGFRPIAVCKGNPEYLEGNETWEAEGRPSSGADIDVFAIAFAGGTVEDAIAGKLNQTDITEEYLDNMPRIEGDNGYDEALSARDAWLDQNMSEHPEQYRYTRGVRRSLTMDELENADTSTLQIFDDEYPTYADIMQGVRDGEILIHSRRLKEGDISDLRYGLEPTWSSTMRSTEADGYYEEVYGDDRPLIIFASDNGVWIGDGRNGVIFVRAEGFQKSNGDGTVTLPDGETLKYELSPNADYEDPFWRDEPAGVEPGDWYSKNTADVVAAMTIPTRASRSEELDEEYMTAVNNGDMGAAQRLVNDAAKEWGAISIDRVGKSVNGAPTPLYHGTSQYGFTVFKTHLPGMLEGIESIYMATDEPTASSYAYGPKAGVYSLFAKIANPCIVDCGGSAANDIRVDGKNDKGQSGYSGENDLGALVRKYVKQAWTHKDTRKGETYSTDQIAYAALQSGNYDGVIFTWVKDSYYNNRTTTDVVVFRDTQVKSAEPVTYDDQGNVIPLSQRFNAKSNDIRYSRAVDDNAYWTEDTLELDEEYMTAVNNGDMDTAEKLVRQAAQAAGYTELVWHGTRDDFTVFDKEGRPIWTALNKRYADLYADDYYYGHVMSLYAKLGNVLDLSGLNTDLPVSDGKNPTTAIEEFSDIVEIPVEDLMGMARDNVIYSVINTAEFADIMRERGYDSIKESEGNGEYAGYTYGLLHNTDIKSADPVTYDDQGNVIPLSQRFNAKSNDIRYSRAVDDEDTLAFLNAQLKKGDVVTTYKTFAEIDGKLYPPIATYRRNEKGQWELAHPLSYGVWEESVGNPKDLSFDSKGKPRFKDSKKDTGKGLDVAYNPYQHSSNLMLNDQFEEAWNRPNLVTVECVIPKSELTSGYHAPYAKDPVGVMDWHAGPVATAISKQKELKRQVYLSRWLMPVRRVGDAEVAQTYKEYLSGTDVSVPFNVVPPNLLAELEKAGVPINYEGTGSYQAHHKKNEGPLPPRYSRTEENVEIDNEGVIIEPEVSEFFKNSRARGSTYGGGVTAYDGQEHLLNVYHGTFSEFYEFERSYGNSYGDWGKGFYFTTNRDDAKYNYASESGPDVENKIDMLTDELYDTGDYESRDDAKEAARKQVMPGEQRILNCYLNVENPVIIGDRYGGRNPLYRSTFFDVDYTLDDDFEVDWDYGVSGLLMEYLDALENNVMDGDNDYLESQFQLLKSKLLSEYLDGIDADTLTKLTKEYLYEWTDPATGAYGAPGELIRQTFEDMGFDGIIDHSVSWKWGANSMSFRPMTGVNDETAHIIVFRSEQIKLTSNKNPTKNKDIRKSRVSEELADLLNYDESKAIAVGADLRKEAWGRVLSDLVELDQLTSSKNGAVIREAAMADYYRTFEKETLPKMIKSGWSLESLQGLAQAVCYTGDPDRKIARADRIRLLNPIWKSVKNAIAENNLDGMNGAYDFLMPNGREQRVAEGPVEERDVIHPVSIKDLRTLFKALSKNTDARYQRLARNVFNTAEQLGLDINITDNERFSDYEDSFDKYILKENAPEYTYGLREAGVFNDTEGITYLTYGVISNRAVGAQYRADVILHELIHACTESAISIRDAELNSGVKSKLLNDEQRSAVDELLAIFDEIKDTDLANKFDLDDAHELIAQTADSRLRRALDKAGDLWTRIKRAIGRIFGVSKSSNTTEELDSILNTLLDNVNRELFEFSVERNERLMYDEEDAFDASTLRYSKSDETVTYEPKDPSVDEYGNSGVYDGKAFYIGLYDPKNKKIVETISRGEYDARENSGNFFTGPGAAGLQAGEYLTFWVYDRRLFLDTGRYLEYETDETGAELARMLTSPDGKPVAWTENVPVRWSRSDHTGAELFGKGTWYAEFYDLLNDGDYEGLANLIGQGLHTHLVTSPNGRSVAPTQIRNAEQNAAADRRLAEAVDKYGAHEAGENPARPVLQPKKVDVKDEITGETVKKNTMRNIRTQAESQYTPEWIADDVMREQLFNELLTYEPCTDLSAINYAKAELKKKGFQQLYSEWAVMIIQDKALNKKHLAVGQLLMNEAAKAGERKIALRISADLAIVANRIGTALQGFRLLKKTTPDGQLYYMQRTVDRLNRDYEKAISKGKMPEITIDEDLATAVLTAATEEELDKAIEKLKQSIADQIPVTLMDKWNAWRYLSMLGNPKTHIRNFLGNFGFVPAIFVKNVLASGIEHFVDPSLKTHDIGTVLSANSPYKKFAREDFKVMRKTLQNGGKYNPTSDIMQMRRIYKNKVLEKLRVFNSQALEGEDLWFLKKHYINALSSYLSKQGFQLTDDFIASPEGVKMLDEARAYAVLEAQKATYRDYSATASLLNQIKRNSGPLGLMFDGIVPFTKTPINIAKRGIMDYSIVGIARGIHQMKESLDAYKADPTSQAARVNTVEAIDTLAAGMSGTMIMVLGFVLTAFGLLRGADPDDDDENNFADLCGHQAFAIETDNGSYTIDWLAPVSLPLFFGNSFYEALFGDGLGNPWELVDAVLKVLEPMSSLTMLDGLNNTLGSIAYSSDSERFALLFFNVLGSYVTQGLPTLGAQVARTIDPNRHYTYVDKNSDVPNVLQRWWQGSVMSKIPILSTQRANSVDQWGNVNSEQNWFVRLLSNFLSPGYASAITDDATNTELARLYAATGASVLPKYQSKYFEIEGEGRKDLTQDEYEELQKKFGQTAYAVITDVINDATYQSMSDTDKVKVIESAYDYASQLAKRDLTEGKKETDTWVTLAEQFGASDYVLLKAQISGAKTNADLFALALSAPGLDDSQRAMLIGSAYTPPETIDSLSDATVKYELDDETQERAKEIYGEQLLSLYGAASATDLWAEADEDTLLGYVDKVRSKAAEVTKTTLATEIENGIYEVTTVDKTASQITGGNNEVYRVALTKDWTTEQQCDFIISNFSGSSSKNKVEFTSDMKAYQKTLYDPLFRKEYTAMVSQSGWSSKTEDQKISAVAKLHKSLMDSTAKTVYNDYKANKIPTTSSSEMDDVLDRYVLTPASDK